MLRLKLETATPSHPQAFVSLTLLILPLCRLDNVNGDLECADDVELSVNWFQRKAFKPGTTDSKTGLEKGWSWGVQPAFTRCVESYSRTRTPIYLTTGAKFGDLLPIPVSVVATSTDAEPKPEQRCVAALVEYCKKYSQKNPQNPLWRSVEDAAAACETSSGEGEDGGEEEEEEGEADQEEGGGVDSSDEDLSDVGSSDEDSSPLDSSDEEEPEEVPPPQKRGKTAASACVAIRGARAARNHR